MILVNIKRIIKSGYVNFWRNPFVSLSSVVIMVITLFVIGSIIFINSLLFSSFEQIKNRVDINVYFVTTAKESDVLTIKKFLENLPEVSKVEYLSRDQALQNFKNKHSEDELTLQALIELGDNPFGAVLNIKAKEPSQYESVAKFLEGESALSTKNEISIIKDINYFKNKVAIDKLSSIIDISKKVGWVFSIILIAISILITFNTIRLAIFTAREEISVMRLVGASNIYIRGPFVISGIMYGIIAAIIVMIIFYPITFWLGPKTKEFFIGLDLFVYYIKNFGEIFFILFGSGVFIGAFSSYLAVKRHLKI